MNPMTMKRVLPKGILLVAFLPPLLWLFVSAPGWAAARNSIRTVRLGTHPQFSRLVLGVEKKPVFKVHTGDKNSVVVKIPDVQWDNQIDLSGLRDERVKKVTIEAGPQGVELRIVLTGPVDQVRSFWLAAGGRLAFDISLQGQKRDVNKEKSRGNKKKAVKIKTVRFGSHQTYSRLVLEMSAEAPYELERVSPLDLLLVISGAQVTADLTLDNFHDQRLQDVSLASSTPERTVFQIHFREPEVELHSYWLAEGGRLVLDVSDSHKKEEPHRLPQKVQTPTAGTGSRKEANIVQAEESQELNQRRSKEQPDAGRGKKENFSRPALDKKRATPETPEQAIRALIARLPAKQAAQLAKILEMYRQGNLSRALELVEQYLASVQGVSTEAGQFLRADILYKLAEDGELATVKKAVKAYRELIIQYGQSSLQPLALSRLAWLHLRLKRYLEAMAYVDLLLRKYPQSALRTEALVCRGRLYLEKGRPDLALRDFDRVVQEKSNKSLADAALLGKAICLSLRGERQEAAEIFSLLQRRDPKLYLKRPEVLYYWGRNEMALGHYASCREKLFRGLNIGGQPQDSSLLLAHIGESYRQQGMTKEAQKFFHGIIKAFPGSEGAMVSLMRLAEDSGSTEMLEQIVREHPESELADFALIRMAGNYYEQGQEARALEALKRLQSAKPNNTFHEQAERLLRKILRKKVARLQHDGDYLQLLVLLKSVDSWVPATYEARVRLWEAEAYARIGLWEDASAVLGKITPEDLEESARVAWIELQASAYEARGERALAEALLRRTMEDLSQDNRKWAIRLQLANLQQRGGKYREAVKHYLELLRGRLPDSLKVEVLLSLARSRTALGQHREAARLYQQVLALQGKKNGGDASLTTAEVALGDLYYQQSNFSSAAQAYQRALQSSELSQGHRLRLYYLLAECQRKMGQLNEADRYYEQVASKGGELWKQFVGVSEKMGRLEAAAKKEFRPGG
ncbi:MAG: tetratricopeptide repeat protein [Deltaproteobacteria bacterium]|nr:tetratricopeptide repeat protein [Deltaproteobacteria bacterium]MBW2069739.1 tetratricopeptide repeat protein [Deltaproteobacteria bacterium]